MAYRSARKQSESSTMRYLDSSVHGRVPVLRAGGETYLWMPATSGGENVWRHVVTRGTSPGNARRRIALKAGNSKNSGGIGTRQPGTPEKRNALPKNWIN